MSLRRLGFDRLASGIFLHLDRVWLEGPGGERHARDVIQHPGGVAVLPIDGDDVLLVRQYRVAVDRWVLEIPAGKLDQPGEPPEEAARRELVEELGVHANGSSISARPSPRLVTPRRRSTSSPPKVSWTASERHMGWRRNRPS